MTNATKGPVHNGSQILFASEDVLVPDLSVKFRLGGRLNSPAIKSALLAEAQTGPTIAFDEWIANIDRHIGNILLGQPGKMWLIDHGHAFTGPNWNGRDLDENRKYKNRLVDALTADMTEAHKNNYMNDSVSIVSAANDIDISAVLDNNFVESFLSNADYNALRDFLNQRRDNIEALTRTALGLVA